MSSEEKEGYFDGPLVTTPNAQGLFLPGGNPQPFVPMATMGQPTVPAPQPPMFYNPGNSVNANSWNAPIQQPFQPSYNAAPQSNPIPPGAQAYFGGLDSGESASSSAQTSPERRPFQKLSDVRLFNPTSFGHHTNPPDASSLFTPQAEEASSSSNSQSAMYNSDQFSSEQARLQSTLPPSGGASGQQSFVAAPASTVFAPSLDVGGARVQTYMNSVAQINLEQHQTPLFVPGPNPDITQPASQGHTDNEPSNDHNHAMGHSFNIHDGATNHGMPGSDQSYLKMAYNHTGSYSGNIQPQDRKVNAYVSGEFSVDTGSPMMIPVTTSGHDYDILHSQGTWKYQRPNVQDGSEYRVGDTVNMVAGSESNPLEENAVQTPTNSDNNVVNHDLGANFQMQDIADEVPQLEASSQLPSNHGQASGAMDVGSNSEFNRLDIAAREAESNIGNDYLKHEEMNQSHDTDSATLTLDYKGSFENSEPGGSTQPDLGTEIQQGYRQSYKEGLTDSVATGNSGFVQKQDLTSQELQDEGYAVGGSVILPDQRNEKMAHSESPIPADGLHHRQPVTDQLDSNPSHLFASPNSAFESRIRSQSIGSNNSNTSSQKSAPAMSGKSTQNRNFSNLGASAGDMNNKPRSENIPASGPFSTVGMHSSHNPDFVASTTPLAPPARATIPDIVRPLPSNSSDENLRTGATMVPYSSNQSLHSQVLTNITAYPPEPSIPASSGSVKVTSAGTSQPDLVQSPLEGSGAIPKSSASTDIANTVAGLKISDNVSVPLTTPAPSGSHDTYLSHTLHISSSNLPPSIVESYDRRPSQDAELSMASGSKPSNVKMDGLHDSSVREEIRKDSDQIRDGHRRRRNSFDRERRFDDDDIRKDFHDDRSRREEGRSRDGDSYREDEEYMTGDDDHPRKDLRESRYNRDRYRKEEQRYRDGPRYRRDEDYTTGDEERNKRDVDRRRRDDEYRSRDEELYSRRYDRPDDSFRGDRYSRSRHDSHSRPSSRQSGYAHEDSYHPSRYDDPYNSWGHRDPYYRGQYWNDRYHGYGRWERYDPSGHHYDYYRRYPEYYPEYSHHHGYGYDTYNYRYDDSRHTDGEDSRSVISEKSRTVDQNPNTTSRDWLARLPYNCYEHISYGYSGGVVDSTVDGSTLSNTLNESWQALPSAPAIRQTPVKFFGNRHTIVRFGAGGYLITVQPNRPMENQPPTVEIHSVELILQGTKEAEDLRSYPGPLSKEETHKNDVLQFTSNQAADTLKDTTMMDRQSTALIWDFLSILVRQNGSVLGTDIAELLTKDHSGDFGLLQSPLEVSRQRQSHHERATPNLVSDEAVVAPSPIVEQFDTKSIVSNVSADVLPVVEKNCFRFRDLLLHGRKKDALEWAMKSGLWGHALLLASKTDSRTHAQVMLRFANSLPINDPLQTVYQLMSGRQPAAATCVSEAGWGDWRPHLAMILSNPTPNPSLDMRAVLTMGDTLSARGLLHASHFCYLMSSSPLGYYSRRSSKMVLLGANHIISFKEFAEWESIRRTEIYEYAISLGKQQKSSSASMSLPSFQIYKFYYACQLMEFGLVAQAFHYCERIAKSICKSPTLYSLTLVSQLVNLSDQLRNHDPQIKAGVTQAGGLRWLETLRNVEVQMQAGSIVPRADVTSSLMTTSNTPSVVSSSPSSGQIEFNPRVSPDLEDDGAEESNELSGNQYGRNEEHTNVQTEDRTKPAMFNPGQTIYQPQQQMQSYSQDTSGVPLNMSNYDNRGTYVNSDIPLPQYQQPSLRGNFNHLADQSNPLAAAQPSAGVPSMGSVPYQTQTSYGFQSYSNNIGREEAEQQDQVDYYKHIENMRPQHQSDPERRRTISQSSQRSRGSTVRGLDRTTPPTATFSYNDPMQGRRSRKESENSAGKRSRKTSGDPSQEKKGKENKEEGVKKSGSWLLGWFSRRKSNQVHLPDDKDKTIVWDNDKKQWVNKDAPEEESAPPPPPPTAKSMAPSAATAPTMQSSGQGGNTGPVAGHTQMTGNRFSLKNLGGNKSMYKNAFSTSSKPVTAPVPMGMPGMSNPKVAPITGFMVPNPVPTSQPLQPMDNEVIPQRNPLNLPDAPQAIPPSNVPNMAPSGPMDTTVQYTASSAGPTMFFNPTQLATQPDLLAQPSLPPVGRGNPMSRRGRGRPMYPGRA